MALHCDEGEWYCFPKKLDQNFLLEKKPIHCWQRVFLTSPVKGKKNNTSACDPAAEGSFHVSMVKSRRGFLGAEHSEC